MIMRSRREKEIKNTKIYTGSPFLKGYVQSFAKLAKSFTKKINNISSQQYKHLTPRKIPLLPTINNLLHPTVVQNNEVTHCSNPITRPYVIWVSKPQSEITKPM